MVPTIGAALSVLLLLIWPAPTGGWLLAIGLALAAIHAGPLLARLWRAPARVQRAIELSAIAAAVPVVVLRHYWESGSAVAVAALAGAGLALLAAALGWRTGGRQGDSRFAWVLGTGAGLLMIAVLFGPSPGQVPLLLAGIAALTLFLARPAGDGRLEWIAGAYALVAVTWLPNEAELDALVWGRPEAIDGAAMLRWAGLAAMAAFFSWRAGKRAVRDGGGFLAAGLAYGAAAQALPSSVMPLAAPLGMLALAGVGRAVDWHRLRAAALALTLTIAGWAFVPLMVWTNDAILSLAGVPMSLADLDLAAGGIGRRLFAPALMLAASVWLMRGKLPLSAQRTGALVAGVLGIVALHCFYRAGFAGLFGSDFVATGLAQRLVWAGLIAGAGYALWKRAGGILSRHVAPALVCIAALHLGWYSLVLHNPLWSDQAVGPIPLANLILPLFAALPLGVWLLGRMVPSAARFAVAALQPVVMVMIALFAWASLRHAFHGSMLTSPGLGQAEDILRSILGIALAVGFLLWGIRARRRDWRLASLVLMLAAVAKVFLFDASGLEGLLRIASFVALGFSLIGIGWLYSRQLRGEVDTQP